MGDSEIQRSKYRYQSHFFYGELLLVLFFAALLIITWFPPLYALLAYGVTHGPTTRAAVFLNLTFAFIVGLFLFLKKEIRGTEFVLTNDRFIKKTPYRISTIKFSDVSAISCRWIPGFRGILKVRSSDAVIKLPFVVENMTGLVSDLVRGLEQTGNLAAYKDASPDDLRARAVLSDASRARAAQAFLPLIAAIVICSFTNIVTASLIWNLSILSVLVWGFAGLPFPMAAYMIADFLINQKLGKSLKSATSEAALPDQPATYAVVGILAFVLYLLSGILYRSVMP